MPKKYRGTHRLPAAIASGILLLAASFWAACDTAAPEPKAIPPTPHKLTDITLRESGELSIHTPTAVVSPEADIAGGGTGDATDSAKEGPAAPPPVEKKRPEKSAKEPTDAGLAPEKHGAFTIQVGAYVVKENLSLVKEQVTSLGYSPYTVEIGRKMNMFCVIVGEDKTEAEAREILSALSGKGFNPRLLPKGGNTVDVAGEIYYYKDDALDAEARIKSLGYTARVEERAVDVILTCLRIGDYATTDEAEKDLNALKQKGFSPVILKSDQ